VNAVTMAVKAAPTTTATARSTTFPQRRKSLKPLSMCPPGSPTDRVVVRRTRLVLQP